MAQPKATQKLVISLLVFVLAALVYGLYGFKGRLKIDDAIYLYSGQQMARGIPPYVSIFDHKGPASPMLAGLGVSTSNLLHIDDIFGV